MRKLTEQNLEIALSCLDEMHTMAEEFEGKKLPAFAVAAIKGWRNRALRALGVVASYPIDEFRDLVGEVSLKRADGTPVSEEIMDAEMGYAPRRQS